MSLFLVTVFAIYGSVHFYALLKAKSALGFGWRTAGLIAPALLALTFTPLIIYHLGKHGMESAARTLSWIGYTWAGILFFFFWTSLLVDAGNLLIRLAGAVSGGRIPASPLAGRTPFLVLAALSVALG
ncbi:MAG TPA: hypothetical protein VE080_02275, partial [Candidatus Aquicultoraceae bacterium]|nr:hypothetical protein [Candidatus Aquicultoraceae bacterium]